MKRIISLFCAFAMLFCLASCSKTQDTTVSEQEENNVVSNETAKNTTEASLTAPQTIMDLFDGERKLWFYISKEDAENGLRYDCPVQQVFVTENKKVVEMYYTFHPHVPNGKNTIPNPLSGEKIILADFDGLNDDAIISALKATYANADTTYNLDFSHLTNYKITSSNVFPQTQFPFNIQYNGDLTDSGNGLENEEIRLTNQRYIIAFTWGISLGSWYTLDEIHFESLVKPTVVKNKEYVGIEGVLGDMLITINNYPHFDSLEFDDPRGVTDW